MLISCISASESDFEETSNTLKYANRACRIKNTPLPNKFLTLEEDLLPMLPANVQGAFNMVQVQVMPLMDVGGRYLHTCPATLTTCSVYLSLPSHIESAK